MDKKTYIDNLTRFSTENLIKIASDLRSLNPEFIPLLQKELINRSEIKTAISITEYLVSIKYNIEENVLFDYILSFREAGLTEKEINDKLNKEHGIDSNYVELIKISLKERGRDNIKFGVALVIIFLILGIVLVLNYVFLGVFPLIIIGSAVLKIRKGFIQIRENKL